MLNILVVDDSRIIRKKLKKHIDNIGHNIIGEAETGSEAIELCKNLKPDLITMDINMPDIDGVTAIKNIRKFDKNVDIIIITSNGQERMIANSLKAGAKGYMLKPINEEKLFNAIELLYKEYLTKQPS